MRDEELEDRIAISVPNIPAHVESTLNMPDEDEPMWWQLYLQQVHPNQRAILIALVHVNRFDDLSGTADFLGISVPKLKALLAHPIVARRIEYQHGAEALEGNIANRQALQKLWSDVAFDPTLGVDHRLRATELLGKSRGEFLDRKQVDTKVSLAEALRQLSDEEGDAH